MQTNFGMPRFIYYTDYTLSYCFCKHICRNTKNISGKLASKVPARWVLFVRAERANNTHASHNNSLASWISWQSVDLNHFCESAIYLVRLTYIVRYVNTICFWSCLHAWIHAVCADQNACLRIPLWVPRRKIQKQWKCLSKKLLKQNYGSTDKVSSTTQFRLYCGPGRCQ